MEKKLGIYKKITMIHLLFLLVMLVFAGGYAMFGLLDHIRTDITLLHFNNILMGATLTILVLYVFSKNNKVSVKRLGWHLTLKDLNFILVVFFVTLCTLGLFIIVLKQNKTLNVTLRLDRFKEFPYYLLLLWAVLGWMLAALKEEVLSRGFVLFNLTQMNIGKMILVSAVVFMVLHIPTNGFDVFKMFSWFMGGVVYAYIYIKSGSLSVATIIHMIHNFLNDWVIGNNSQFAIVELSQKLAPDDKLIYELILKVVILIFTIAFYGRSGLTTPAPNLKELWFKNDRSKVDAERSINPSI
ncbi:lysostaphin resistance A-like protein [Bacillus coreaensis]